MGKQNRKALLLAPMSSVHERFNTANFEALKELQCEIHVAANFNCNDHDKEYERHLKEKGIVIHNIPFIRSSLFGNLQTVPIIRKLLKEQNFDIAHCHTETGGILMRLAMVNNGKTKYAYTPHGMSFYKGSSLKSQVVYRPIERWICSGMDANLAMNEEEYDVLQKWNEKSAYFIHGIGVSLESIQCLTVDIAAKKLELGIPADATVIMSVGEINVNKNHTIVLDAIVKLKNIDKVYYLICGEGDKREDLISQANDLGIGNRLILPGYRYDMAEIFHVGDIFVFPSFHEGLSVALMQSMVAGMPVVCSKIRGNIDLIKEGKNGYLFHPKDSETIAVALKKLLADSRLRKKMGEQNKITISGYSLLEVKKETYNIYDSLI